MTVAEPTTAVLTESLIDRCGQRAPGYDRENRFFHEDFEELTQAGYLKLNVPTPFARPPVTTTEQLATPEPPSVAEHEAAGTAPRV